MNIAELPRSSRSTFLRSTLLGLATSVCSRASIAFASPNAGAVADTVARPAGWSEESHAKSAAPDLDLVFSRTVVKTLTITIAPEHWQAMQDNMLQLYGARGTVPDPPPGTSGPQPMWVPATIEFNGKKWTNVGVRYKGSASLRGSWNSGYEKMPLKLDFDQFEDQHPEIKDQRFYGLKQLSLANNWVDRTHLSETLAYALLERTGLAVSRTAPYEVILDHGQGPASLGLYTAIEVVDDTLIKRFFKDDKGNIYEAEGPAASLESHRAGEIEQAFRKANNSKKADWSDLKRLHQVLHAGERTANPAAWRSRLESIFEVDVFLCWLSAAAAMQHWDTYGTLAHNFYLYNNPDSGKLYWISWDHDLVFGNGGTPRISLDREVIGNDWPLVRFLLDDPEYARRYIIFMREFVSHRFVAGKLEQEIKAMADVRAPYARKETSAADYEAAVKDLLTRVAECAQSANDLLATQ